MTCKFEDLYRLAYPSGMASQLMASAALKDKCTQSLLTYMSAPKTEKFPCGWDERDALI